MKMKPSNHYTNGGLRANGSAAGASYLTGTVGRNGRTSIKKEMPKVGLIYTDMLYFVFISKIQYREQRTIN